MLKKTLYDYKKIVSNYPQEILFSSSHYFFGGFGQTFFIAFLIPFIQKKYHITDYKFGIYYGICTICSALLLPSSGRIYDRTNVKVYAISVLFLLCTGLLLIASNLTLYITLLGIFLLRFSGQGLFSQIPSTTTARYFDTSRGKALSLSSLGASLSEAIFPVIFIALTKFFSWQETLLIFIFVTIFFYTLFYSLGMRKSHSFYESRFDIKNTKEEKKIKSFMNSKMIFLMIQFSLPAFILTGLFFHKISIGNLKTWDQDFLAMCFMVFAGSKIFFSILAGSLVDKYSAQKLSKFYLFPMIISLFAFYSSNHYSAAVSYLFFAGMTLGFGGSIQSSIWAEIFPPHILGSIKSTMLQCIVFSTASAPALFGFILDSSFEFHHFILSLIFINILFAFLNLKYVK